MKPNHLMPITSALVLAVASTVYAQEKPYTAPAAPAAQPTAIEKFLNVDGKLPEALAKGKFNLNVRLRYEFAEQQVNLPSHAPTIRTRFGYTSAPLNGFQGMLEGENVSIIGDRDNFNAAGTSPGAVAPNAKAVVADPPVTQLNQAWLGYTKFDTTLKAGRQRIALDNHRFVGDVGWRQNMQTFDAITVESKYFKDFNLYYGYVWEANRVFGDLPTLAAANRDFTSDSHLINLSYSGWKYGKVTAYAYLLGFENSAANSSATYGLSFAGAYTFDKETNLKANYRAEYARQCEYRNQPLNYDADYYNLESSLDYKKFNVGAGYEVLGSDKNSLKGFATPLATLHAFNGWADLFLATPATGLRDVYAFAGVKLPYEVPLKVIYHKFDSDRGGTDLGYEWDAVISRAFGKNWTAMLKYAYYDGKSAALPDTQKLWAQVEFNF